MGSWKAACMEPAAMARTGTGARPVERPGRSNPPAGSHCHGGASRDHGLQSSQSSATMVNDYEVSGPKMGNMPILGALEDPNSLLGP